MCVYFILCVLLHTCELPTLLTSTPSVCSPTLNSKSRGVHIITSYHSNGLPGCSFIPLSIISVIYLRAPANCFIL